MKCPNCHTENNESSKFCSECGGKLEIVCLKCKNLNPPGSKFCTECGNPICKSKKILSGDYTNPRGYTPKYLADKILTSRAVLEGERKLITVLFADLKSSMELIAQRDPEEARKILDPIIEILMKAVHHYEGTVTQIMGDGILALFGAPLAHEDHAMRACYSALKMQENIIRHNEELRRTQGVEVQIRVGLNSGEVVVRSIGNDLHMEYTAIGQTTHLAARMEQLAAPGSVRFTSETHRLSEGFFEVKSLGPVPVKGMAEPVEVFELIGAKSVRSRLQPAVARGLSRFVGRDSEIEHLHSALQQAGTGNGQLLAVVGEAGVGKSRLFHEFTQSERTRGWLILEAASFSYGKATPFLPVMELLKRYFRVFDLDDQREITEKITGKLLTLDRSLETAIPDFLAIFDIPVENLQWQALDPSQRRLRTLDSIKRLLLRESQVQPVFLVFEDLHWVDGETQALLEVLVEALPRSKLLLLVNYRPDYHHSWANRTYYRQIRLDPLQADTAGRLLDSLLGSDSTIDSFKKNLISQTGGNPFFLEESVRMLVETGIFLGGRGNYRLTSQTTSIQIPATVQTILAARIDRLQPDDKNLLQCAAVIGKDFPYALLKEISGLSEENIHRGLNSLQTSEFLYETHFFPDLEYTFKHALTYEVAYNSLLQERRKYLHATIVAAIERLYPDRIEEQVEVLSRHAVRGELWEKAFVYLKQAGHKAAWRSAYPEAAAYFEQALTILPQLPENREMIEMGIDLRLSLRPIFVPLADFPRSLIILQEAEALARRLGDQRRLGMVMMNLGHHFWTVGDHERSVASNEHGSSLLIPLQDLDLKIGIYCYLAQAYHGRGDYQKAIDYAAWNIAALESDPLSIHKSWRGTARALPSVFSRCWLAWSMSEVGNFKDGATRAEEGIKIAEAADHLFSLFHASWGAGVLFLRQGNLQRAIKALERSRWICQIIKLVLMNNFTIPHLGFAYALDGRIKEGLTLLEEAVQQTEALGMMFCHTISLTLIGEAFLMSGRINDAIKAGQRALELCRKYSCRGYEGWALRLLGEIFSHEKGYGFQTAENYYREAMALAKELGMRPLMAHCHLGLGRVYRLAEKIEQAKLHLVEATRMFRDMEMPLWLEKAKEEKGGVL
jgi:class 3 adenylate cyclase/tetratricopeptide (TPR) repeat protein